MPLSQEVTKEYLIPVLASLLDGGDIVPGRGCNERAKPLINACRGSTGGMFHLKAPINRNDFLAAAFQLTKTAPVEHLLVGLGYKAGNTTKIVRVYHVIGKVDFVDVPESVIEAISSHVASNHRAEALMFHNHPANLRHALFDHRPLASRQDRTFMLRLLSHPEVGLKSAAGGGTIRFYLGENGFVREFRTPNFDQAAILAGRAIEFGALLLKAGARRAEVDHLAWR